MGILKTHACVKSGLLKKTTTGTLLALSVFLASTCMAADEPANSGATAEKFASDSVKTGETATATPDITDPDAPPSKPPIENINEFFATQVETCISDPSVTIDMLDERAAEVRGAEHQAPELVAGYTCMATAGAGKNFCRKIKNPITVRNCLWYTAYLDASLTEKLTAENFETLYINGEPSAPKDCSKCDTDPRLVEFRTLFAKIVAGTNTCGELTQDAADDKERCNFLFNAMVKIKDMVKKKKYDPGILVPFAQYKVPDSGAGKPSVDANKAYILTIGALGKIDPGACTTYYTRVVKPTICVEEQGLTNYDDSLAMPEEPEEGSTDEEKIKDEGKNK